MFNVVETTRVPLIFASFILSFIFYNHHSNNSSPVGGHRSLESKSLSVFKTVIEAYL